VARAQVKARDELVVSLDLGTSACKVVAFDRRGRRAAYGRSTYDNLLGANGRAEQNPLNWWKGLKEAIHASGIQKRRNPIVGYTISTLRAAVLAVDGRGRPLAPAILASDRRATEETDFLAKRFGEERLYKTTGLRSSTYSSLARILWLKNHKPDIFARTARILCAQDYLVNKLCEYTITDRSHASRTLCLDIHTKQWNCKLMEPLGLWCDLFPTVVDPGTVIGELSSRASRALQVPVAPVIAAGGDQMCASVGLGAVNSEQVSINHGTGSFVERPTPAPVLDKQRKSLASIHVLPDRWVQEFPILLTGSLLEHLAGTTFGSRADFPRSLESALSLSPCAGRQTSLMFLPYQGGSTAPHWNDDLPGVLWGLRCHHQTSNVLRSLLEAVIFDLRRCIAALPQKPKEILVGGHLTHARAFNQMQADIFDIPVTKPLETEATALGAAVVAFIALGFHPSAQAAVEAMVHCDDNCGLVPNTHTKSYYEDLFNQQSELLKLATLHAKG
jgi:sugar (pentulose or hexulose) kinase